MDDTKIQDRWRDDIDLLALLEKSIFFIRKYRWLLAGGAIVGLALGLLLHSSGQSLFKSRLVLQSTLLSNQNNIQIVSNWNNLIRSGEVASLASIFKMDETVLKKLRSLKAEEIQKIFTPQNPNGFYIDARVTDRSILPALQNGIVFGFDNNGMARERLVAKRSRINEMITKTGQEIQRLDSIKNIMQNILQGKQPGNALILDAPGISRQLIDMNEKHLGYREELLFANAVQVVQGFSEPKEPVQANLLVGLIIGFVPCLAITYIIALFHSINQKLKLRARPPT